jgi:hypothetical protein
MTREQIASALSVLVLQLANGDDLTVPSNLQPHEWAYIKGVASAEILRLRDRIVAAGDR